MTRLPGPVAWLIDGPKISAYLLNVEHPRDASKAKYLMSFGSTPEAPGVLADALVWHALSNPLGTKVMPSYELPRVVCEGTVVAPDGREMPLRTVWEVRNSTEMHFVTAVPLTRWRAPR